MVTIFLILLIFQNMNSQTIIKDFSKNNELISWKIVNDNVMGGKSEGNFEINEQKNAVFFGKISLENNGGFSMVKREFSPKIPVNSPKIVLKIKGDGNAYNLRIKAKIADYFSYSATFKTSKKWETIEINTFEMIPVFRGNTLSLPKFSSDSIEELAFLIGNKREEHFRLEIESIIFE